MEILKVTNLTKVYGQQKAVDHINMSIKTGEIYGFLGQNGAGKTTTLRMVMGLIRPTSGDIELFGEKVKNNSHEIYRKIGSIIEFPGFYPNLSAVENLNIHRLLMGIKDRDSIDEALTIVDLAEDSHRRVKDFSLGMKQRLGIARALLHKPELLILDEPTNGLDPVGIKDVRQLIGELATIHNISVLISSHILSEVQQLATKIGIIHQGKLLEEIDVDTLNKKNGQYVELRVSDYRAAANFLRQDLKISDIKVAEPDCLMIYQQNSETARINRLLVERNIDVREIKLVQESLEDYFMQLTGGGSVA